MKLPKRPFSRIIAAAAFAGLCAFSLTDASAQTVPRNQASAFQWPDISTPVKAKSAAASKADAALVIGISKYAFVPAVNGAVQNAEDWWMYLRKTRGIPRQNIGFLRDEEATAEKIREEARRVASLAGPGGTIWFVFVGHGVASAGGEEGMLVGMDAQGNASSLDARSIRQSEIEGLFRASKAARTVMLVDSCFSGQTPDGKPLAQGLQALVRTSQAKAESKTIRLTAGKSDQYAGPLPGAQRPAFSYLILGALRGWGDDDGDGQVTAEEAVGYAGEVLSLLEKGRRQTPELVASEQSKKLALSKGVSEKGPDLDAMLLAMRPASSVSSSSSASSSSSSSSSSSYSGNPVNPPASGQSTAAAGAVNSGEQSSSDDAASVPAADAKVYIPGGHFADSFDIDGVTHHHSSPFWVSKTLVTVNQFSQCVAAGVCPAANFKSGSDMKDCNYGVTGRGNHPMNCVDYYAARAFCQWNGGGRIPTRDEWLFAALSGPDGVREATMYPWGNGRPNKSLMNFNQKRGGQTTPVGQFSPAGDSPLGVQDICGNVWEWTSTGAGGFQIINGGAYNSGGIKASLAYYTQASPSKIRADYGFRCVWDPAPAYTQPPPPPPPRHHRRHWRQ